MFHSVQIDGYRGLSHFEMRDLGRVNLLVGKNNCGKTSVLEALYLLGTDGDPAGLWRIGSRRGERFVEEGPDSRFRPDNEIDVSHLFSGHELIVGQSISMDARNTASRQSVKISVDELADADHEPPTAPLLADDLGPYRRSLSLRVTGTAFQSAQVIPLSRKGGLDLRTVEVAGRKPIRSNRKASAGIHYISTESLGGAEVIRHWDRIQLTPHEELVLSSLRFVDDTIEQIRAVLGGGGYYGGRGGFIVKRKGDLSPFPLGSLGDGAWRLLAMAVTITQCADGMLFIDEIDTGLHHTVMADMWRLIRRSAEAFNIQVFATTHSYDCVQSLSSICHEEGNDVTIQRIEADRPVSIPFSEAEIRTVAEQHIEIR